MTTYDLTAPAAKNDSLDIKGFFLKLVTHWYYFAISLVVFISLATLYLKQTAPTFEVNTTLLISQSTEYDIPSDALMQNLRQYGTNRSLENEIGFLTSFNLIREVVDSLNLGVGYYEKGFFMDVERYTSFPVEVILDPSQYQILNSKFFITFSGGDKYKLTVEADGYMSYRYEDNTNRPQPDKKVNWSGEGTFGTQLTTEWFSFTVNKRNPDANLGAFAGSELYFTLLNPNVVTDKYRNGIKVDPISLEATVVDITTDGPVVKKETDVLRTLCNTYINKRLREKNYLALKTIEFIDNQLSNVTDSLRNAEGALQSLRSSSMTMNPGQTAAEAGSRQYQLQSNLQALYQKQRYCESLLADLADSASFTRILAPSAAGIDDPLLGQLISDLKNQYSERAGIIFRNGSGSIEAELINKRIRQSTQQLGENVRNILAKTEGDIAAMQSQIGELASVIRRQPGVEMDMLRLERRYNFNETHRNYLLQKRTEAAITMTANTPDSRVLDEARMVGNGPVAPNKGLVMGLSILFAMLIPTLVIFVKESMDDTIKGQSQAEAMSRVPVLGTVAHNKKDEEMYEVNNLTAESVESFRYLKVNLQFVGSDRKHKVIGVTSTIPHEGKTFITFNLASVTAISGHKTIVIGGDIRKPALYKVAKVENTIGLTNYLINQASVDQIIQRTHIKDLDIITSGPIPPNPADLLNKPQFEQLIQVLRERYEYVYIDNPPIGLVSDFLLTSRYTDVSLYVIRAGYSKVHFFEDIDKLRNMMPNRSLYLIINDVKYSPRNYYGYKYGRKYPYKYGVEAPNGKLNGIAKKRFNKLFSNINKKTQSV
ncbi:MAG: polysaccharide biosynthesis tyrosine autokinase [Bacteroidia bacterium]|nr:polysaccharide biosynthesis tyrosine autokinase [Bacteroidia bacterium]